MSSKSIHEDGKKKKRSLSKGKIANEFHGNGVVEGLIPIPDKDEVDIQNAREVLEARSRKNVSGKPYKVKVIGTETSLILKRKSVMGSGPKEQAMLCNEVYRFFIFARDPKLVILVVPNKPNEKRAYLLLKMKDETQANQVCNVIQNGRKHLNSVQPVQPPITTEKTPEMQENGTPVDKNASETEESDKEIETPELSSRSTSPDTIKKSILSHASSQETVEKIPLLAAGKVAVTTVQAGDSRSESVASKMHSETSSTRLSDYSTPNTASKERSESQISTSKKETSTPSASQHHVNEKISMNSHKIVNSAAPINYVYESSSDESSTPRSLPRQPLEEVHGQRRRQAPVTEEMELHVASNWKPNKPTKIYKGDDLKKILLRDMYDKDWAVDVKIIENVGDFGSRISDNGNVYMFTAHHMVPENYCHLECSSSSESEKCNQRQRSKKASGTSSHTSHLISSSSEDEDLIHKMSLHA